MPEEHDRGNDLVGVLDRMTMILDAFDDDQGLGLSELALRAGLPKSTVSRLVAGLVRQRYLERDGSIIYLGLRLFELGQLADVPRELRRAALGVMANLRAETGHTVHLALRDGHEMVLIALMRGRDAVACDVRVGGRVPAHASALGKAVLAHTTVESESESEFGFGFGFGFEFGLDGTLPARTPHTITDPRQLLAQLADVRGRGFAIETHEFVVGVASVASPVFSAAGAVIAAIGVSARAAGFQHDRIAPRVRASARALEHRLALRGSGSR